MRGIQVAIIVIAFLMRWLSPGRLGLWGDEAQFLAVAGLRSPAAIIAFLARHESHPPLLYVLGHLMGAPTDEAANRLSWFMVFCSTAIVAAAWWVASLSRRRAAGPIAAVLTGCSIPLAIFGVQLRPYALFSLLLLLSVGCLVRAVTSTGRLWRPAWATSMVLLLYLHHLALVVLATELLTLLLLLRGTCSGWRQLRSWSPWLGTVAVLAIPDVCLFLTQRRLTGYLPIAGVRLSTPIAEFARLCLIFPAELGLAAVGCLSALVSRRMATDDLMLRGVVRATAAVFLLSCGAMMLSAYRHAVLVDHLMLPFAPAGLVCVAVLVADLVQCGRRVAGAVWLLGAVGCLTLGGLFSVGYAKASVDELGAYIGAEGQAGDLVILFPGSFGPALNRSLGENVSQIDYPFIGPARPYRFNDSRNSVLDRAALDKARDSIGVVRRTGRRVWVVMPSSWLVHPSNVVVDSTSSLSAAYRWRGRQLFHVLLRAYGRPARTFDRGGLTASSESFSLAQFDSPPGASR